MNNKANHGHRTVKAAPTQCTHLELEKTLYFLSNCDVARNILIIW